MTTSLRRSSGSVLGFAANSNHSSSSSSSFSSRSYARLYGSMSSSPSVRRNSVPDRSTSPKQSISTPRRERTPLLPVVPQKKACICSPSNHPGSFRCSLHKVTPLLSPPLLSQKTNNQINQEAPKQIIRDTAKPLNQLNNGRSDEENDIAVKFRTAQVQLVERALNRSTGYSSDSNSNEHRPRHARFQIRPSKLSVMSKA